MKTKFLIPVLAAIFAIGMSFTTIENESDPSQDYILQNGDFMPLGTELNCGTGVKTCKVKLQNGNVYDVYDAADPNSLKRGNGEVIIY
ncbi:DUF6520 family protein [Gillisia sp. JM1]|uniref:DUF6520 family protein n=1 Tax=Gillisia sp. JM1 TaxID=1283286 RepID=UPI000424B099|nr:DUF6520 family protein [Gillisia sp. JM1]